MAHSITPLYDVETVVWVIGVCGIDKATTKKVSVTETQAVGIVIVYEVKIDGIAGVSSYLEADTFGTKAAAITDYETRVAS